MTNYTTTQPWKAVLGLTSLGLLAFTTTLLAADAGADAGVQKETMFGLIKKGGPIMIPLGIASIIALALAIERYISLRRDKILPVRLPKSTATRTPVPPATSSRLASNGATRATRRWPRLLRMLVSGRPTR